MGKQVGIEANELQGREVQVKARETTFEKWRTNGSVLKGTHCIQWELPNPTPATNKHKPSEMVTFSLFYKHL